MWAFFNARILGQRPLRSSEQGPRGNPWSISKASARADTLRMYPTHAVLAKGPCECPLHRCNSANLHVLTTDHPQARPSHQTGQANPSQPNGKQNGKPNGQKLESRQATQPPKPRQRADHPELRGRARSRATIRGMCFSLVKRLHRDRKSRLPQANSRCCTHHNRSQWRSQEWQPPGTTSSGEVAPMQHPSFP